MVLSSHRRVNEAIRTNFQVLDLELKGIQIIDIDEKKLQGDAK